ncbi:MAG: chemotaxis protein CheA [Bacteroidota bacterium]
MSGPSFAQYEGEMAELLESFTVETNEIFEKLGPDLISLEKNPSDSELHNRIFRAVHTVKGTSSFLGFDQLTELAHNFEDVLNKIRRGELAVSKKRMDVMFSSFDVLKELLQRIEQRNPEPVEIDPSIEQLQAIARNEDLDVTGTADAVDSSTAEIETSGMQHEQGVQSTEKPVPEHQTVPSTAKTAESTIRVDVARLDELMNLVGELVLGRNRLSQINYKMNEAFEGHPIVRDLVETSSQVDLITTELQMAVMKTRMVQIAKVFNKMPRLVRDLSRELSRDIDLQMFGEETELDKSIIEEINDPLVHILRNAADHGIELPADRIKAGKNPKGTIVIKAEHEGNHIVISIQDDGNGINPEVIKRKSVEKGLITAQQAAEMSKREALNLIFAPGLSTAEKVSNVSGRGVGMDVVKTNITKLKGIVDIESEIGIGSKFIIKLPLTLAIIQGLLVKSCEETFAIPLSSVLEVVRVRKSEIETIHGFEVIRLRDTVLPLAQLNQIFSVNQKMRDDQWQYIVVIGLAEERLGIMVDSLLGQREVVIKSLGDYLGAIPGIAGSTILGDGKVIMIIDVGQFMALSKKNGDKKLPAAAVSKEYSLEQAN